MKTSILFLFSLLTSLAWGQPPVNRPTPTTSVSQTGAMLNTPLSGEKIYKQYCLSCHQASGSGVPKLNPPLKGTDWVLGDKTRLINVILKGLQNAEVEDEIYDNVMPAHDFLTDQQIADVLTYVRSHFGNQASAIAPEDVKATRATVGKQ